MYVPDASQSEPVESGCPAMATMVNTTLWLALSTDTRTAVVVVVDPPVADSANWTYRSPVTVAWVELITFAVVRVSVTVATNWVGPVGASVAPRVYVPAVCPPCEDTAM